jgi:hypothetical protein
MRNHAFATCIIRNDSYLPGALVQAHALREQETPAQLVCLVTPEVSREGCRALGLVFDRVLVIGPIVCPESRDQGRQHVSHVMSRINVLRLGPDGDLGCGFEKVVLLDADVLPIRCFDHLFLLDAPAGTINERADHLKRTDAERKYVADGPLSHGRWQWHHHYRRIPHGERIPRALTDRVTHDPANYGINTAVLVVRPSMDEFYDMVAALSSGTGAASRLRQYRWPDMQFLTAYWSGRWHNVDACFAGLSGYPQLELLFGTHFAGPKPWSFEHPTVARRFRRFPDFRRWYVEYLELMNDYPALRRRSRFARLECFARETLVELPAGRDILRA